MCNGCSCISGADQARGANEAVEEGHAASYVFLGKPPFCLLCLERSFSHRSEWTWKVEIRTRKTFLTVGEAYIWLYYDLLHFLVSPAWAFCAWRGLFPLEVLHWHL